MTLLGAPTIFGERFDPSLSPGLYFGVAEASNDGIIEGFDTGSFIGAIFIIELALAELAVYVTDTDLTD